MSTILQQSAVGVVHVGPLLSNTDFKTVQTSVTLSASTIELFKAGSGSSVDISSGRTWTHITGGVYSLSLTASDTDTPGTAIVHVHTSGVVPNRTELLILPASTRNGLLLGTQLPADVTKINGSTTAAANVGLSAQGIQSLTVSTGSSTTQVTTNLTVSLNNFYTGRTLVFTSGALTGQATTITAYNGTTHTLTVAALTGTPVSTDTAVIV